MITCPHCQQALIVPTITSTEWEEEKSDYVPIPGNYEKRSFSVENRNLPYRIDDFQDESDLLAPVRSAPIEDSEFLSRATGDPEAQRPIPPPLPNGESISNLGANTFSPPVLDLVSLSADSEEETERRSLLFPSFLIAMLLLIMGSGLYFWQFHGKKSDPEAGVEAAPVKKIPIEGELIFMDANNKPQKDEGSLIFLFPEKFPKDRPLTISGLAPNRPKPVDYKEFKQKLTDLGGYCAEADSNGTFDLFVAGQGKYRVLLISAHVFQKQGADHKKEFAEIGQFLYQPDQFLLADYKFSWTTWNINEENGTFGHNFGRSDGKILP